MCTLFTVLFIIVSISLIFLITYYSINNEKLNFNSSLNNLSINLGYINDPINNIIYFFSLIFFILSLILKFYY